MVQAILSFLFIFTSTLTKASDSAYTVSGKLDEIKSGIIYLNIYDNLLREIELY